MANLRGLYMSCGVQELYSLDPLEHINSAPKRIMRTVYDYREGRPFVAFLIFSDLSKGPGKTLAEFIVTNKLGTITASESVKNPNSGNKIIVWIWQIDWKVLAAYCEEDKKVG